MPNVLREYDSGMPIKYLNILVNKFYSLSFTAAYALFPLTIVSNTSGQPREVDLHN
jgi:hypothetical protein